jgi:HK97 family phage portal protein
MPTFLQRLGQAYRHVFQPSEQRSWQPLTSLGGSSGAFSPSRTMEQYHDNNWVHSAVFRSAFKIASIDFKLKDLESGDFLPGHQAQETLDRPQPLDGRSIINSFTLKFLTAQHLFLAGESYWLLGDRLKANRAPTAIRVLSPTMTAPIIEKGKVQYYESYEDHQLARYAPEDVVHFKLIDPLNPGRGVSPIKSVRYSIATQREADETNYHRMRNNANVDGFLKTESKLDDEEARMYSERWHQKYGGPRNQGKVPVLGHNLDYKTTGMSNHEMQYVESRHEYRDDVLGVYGTGLEILGRTESQTRANAEAAIYVYMEFGIDPFAKMMQVALDTEYLTQFPKWESKTFHYDDPVPDNKEEKRATAGLLFTNGAMTRNEMREEFGMDMSDAPGMDDFYIPFNMVPAAEPPGNLAA